MKELAAYLLLVLSGNASPSADDVKGVLSSVGIESSDDEVSKIAASLEGKDLDAIVEAGKKKLVSVGGGGGGAAVASSAGGAAPAAGGAAKAEEKKKEEVRHRYSVGMGDSFSVRGACGCWQCRHLMSLTLLNAL